MRWDFLGGYGSSELSWPRPMNVFRNPEPQKLSSGGHLTHDETWKHSVPALCALRQATQAIICRRPEVRQQTGVVVKEFAAHTYSPDGEGV